MGEWGERSKLCTLPYRKALLQFKEYVSILHRKKLSSNVRLIDIFGDYGQVSAAADSLKLQIDHAIGSALYAIARNTSKLEKLYLGDLIKLFSMSNSGRGA